MILYDLFGRPVEPGCVIVKSSSHGLRIGLVSDVRWRAASSYPHYVGNWSVDCTTFHTGRLKRNRERTQTWEYHARTYSTLLNGDIHPKDSNFFCQPLDGGRAWMHTNEMPVIVTLPTANTWMERL